MARPRTHDLDELLAVAERLATESGPAGLTLRGLATAAGVSNGSIYHAFSSKEELLARVWLRAARRFLLLQTQRVELVLDDAHASTTAGAEAVVQAALAPVEFAELHPAAARLFFAQRRDQLFTPELPAEVTAELESVQARFTSLLIRLADGVWQRHDGVAVEAVAACVVDLPGGLIRRRLLSVDGLDEHTATRIAAATRAILDLPLPPRKEHRT